MMKRIGNLIPRIAEWSNLLEAFWKARKGCRDRQPAREFGEDFDRNLSQLIRGIYHGTVPVGLYHRFTIRDPKCRVIHAASFPERVLHHAVMNVCGTIFERGAVDDSYACRPGKGNSRALERAESNAAQYRFFLQMDIRRYFDTIDHAILEKRFRRFFKDQDLLTLLDRIVDSYQTAPGRGLPIGALTSQYFANFHLDPLDRFVKEDLRSPGYVRYMDDFVLWSDSRDQLQGWIPLIRQWLQAHLKLSLKESIRSRATSQGMTFLGYRVLPGRLLLSRVGRRRFEMKIRACEQKYLEGRMSEQELQQRAVALLSHLLPARCETWRRKLVRRLDSYENELF